MTNHRDPFLIQIPQGIPYSFEPDIGEDFVVIIPVKVMRVAIIIDDFPVYLFNYGSEDCCSQRIDKSMAGCTTLHLLAPLYHHAGLMLRLKYHDLMFPPLYEFCFWSCQKSRENTVPVIRIKTATRKFMPSYHYSEVI
jgi:hypothetical protein